MKITSENNPSTLCRYCGSDHDYYTDIYLNVIQACMEGKIHHNDHQSHCHEKGYGFCMPYIEDCESHWESCEDSCHDECACQNP